MCLLQYYLVRYIYIYIYITDCVAQLAKASDTQLVGPEFEPRPEH